MTSIKDLIIPLFNLAVLIVTFIIYIRLLNVSKQTLKFTKSKTSFNIYLDNFKLYNEISKREIGIVILDNELQETQRRLFENISLENIHFAFLQILENFPLKEKNVEYGNVFNRFNAKVQSFIDTIKQEIVKINSDEDLTIEDKTTLIALYTNFLLYEYINLCTDLVQNREINEQGLSPSFVPDYLKCNYNNKKIFDIENFLTLYKELETK